MVGLLGGGEGRWISGSDVHWKVVPLRASTSGRLEKLHKRALASLLSLAPPAGMPALPDPPQHTQ